MMVSGLGQVQYANQRNSQPALHSKAVESSNLHPSNSTHSPPVRNKNLQTPGKTEINSPTRRHKTTLKGSGASVSKGQYLSVNVSQSSVGIDPYFKDHPEEAAANRRVSLIERAQAFASSERRMTIAASQQHLKVIPVVKREPDPVKRRYGIPTYSSQRDMQDLMKQRLNRDEWSFKCEFASKQYHIVRHKYNPDFGVDDRIELLPNLPT